MGKGCNPHYRFSFHSGFWILNSAFHNGGNAKNGTTGGNGSFTGGVKSFQDC